ncbi:MAG: HD domain-containing protein [Chitinivibrionales bacterium]|nr:HD domain-containing protein [Chitinivibrionales bacterium]
MEEIRLSNIKAGTIAEYDYYSDDGTLLIGKGVEISEKLLQTLRRRTVFGLFRSRKNSKIHAQTGAQSTDAKVAHKHRAPEKGNDTPSEREDFTRNPLDGPVDIMHDWNEAFQERIQTSPTFEIDKLLTPSNLIVSPSEKPLSRESGQIEYYERSESYKYEVRMMYNRSIKAVERIFDLIEKGQSNDISGLYPYVEKIIDIYLHDKDILLNLAGTRHNHDYLFHHALNVCLLAIIIAAAHGYSKEQIIELAAGAILNDIGMMFIPRIIRFEQSKLSDSQWRDIQRHPVLGLDALQKIRDLPQSIPFVCYQSHERINATGYPRQYADGKIHTYAKIVQIADIYAAQSSPRSYRKALMPCRAMVGLIKLYKGGFIPPVFVQHFVQATSLFPIGSLVQLNDRRIARVIHSNKRNLSKPLVSVLTDHHGAIVDKSKIQRLDLYEDRDFEIIRALNSDYLQNLDIMRGF